VATSSSCHTPSCHNMAHCPSNSTPALVTGYQCKGKEVETQGLSIYQVGAEDSSACVIVFYDIFGSNGGRTRQVCDELAEAGFLVLLPDFFRGPGWDPKDMPPKGGFDSIRTWIEKVGNWDTIVKPDVYDKILPYIKSKPNSKKIGAVGFCWGGKQVLRTCNSSDQLSAGIGVHASALLPEDAENVQCPIMLLPGSNDAPIDPIKEVLDKKPIGKDCVYRRFDDQVHGWSVRGDISNPAIKAGVDECFRLVHEFFKKQLLH